LVRVATIRDHIVPLAEGGADDRANTQALCKSCNDAKAIAESLRGRRR
jgi:5-methylcytosine-specific restriction enzyme A